MFGYFMNALAVLAAFLVIEGIRWVIISAFRVLGITTRFYWQRYAERRRAAIYARLEDAFSRRV